jgi:hypothetical protein
MGINLYPLTYCPICGKPGKEKFLMESGHSYYACLEHKEKAKAIRLMEVMNKSPRTFPRNLVLIKLWDYLIYSACLSGIGLICFFIWKLLFGNL